MLWYDSNDGNFMLFFAIYVYDVHIYDTMRCMLLFAWITMELRPISYKKCLMNEYIMDTL